MNRQELYRAAKRQIETRRQQAETEAARRRRQIEEQVPGLLELEGQRGEAGAAAALMAAGGDKAGAARKLEEVQEIAKRREMLLAQHGYAQEDLRPVYACALCNDSGVYEGGMCVCVRQEAKRLRRAEINDAGPLRLCSFESFSLEYYPEEMEGLMASPRREMEKILRDCRDYAGDFGLHSPSLFMYGDTGLGKTHLALSIAAEVLEKGWDVIYVSAQSAFAEISADRYVGGSELFSSMLEADLLVLDDLGIEFLDQYILSKLYELINARMSRRPTVYTTNICKQEALNLRYPEKITSRLLGDCHRMRFLGYDLRLHKKQGAL